MSNNIATIKASQNVRIPTKTDIKTTDINITITRFAGKEGQMIQLGWYNPNNHIFLNKEQIKELIKALKGWETNFTDVN